MDDVEDDDTPVDDVEDHAVDDVEDDDTSVDDVEDHAADDVADGVEDDVADDDTSTTTPKTRRRHLHRYVLPHMELMSRTRK